MSFARTSNLLYEFDIISHKEAASNARRVSTDCIELRMNFDLVPTPSLDVFHTHPRFFQEIKVNTYPKPYSPLILTTGVNLRFSWGLSHIA